MFNIAFSLVNGHGGQSAIRQQDVPWTNLLTGERPSENSESESNTKLLSENFEIGLFVSQTAFLSPLESPAHGKIDEAFAWYQNHEGELNSPPPKAV